MTPLHSAVSQWLHGSPGTCQKSHKLPKASVTQSAGRQAGWRAGHGQGCFPKLTRADLPTPPEPRTTSLYSRMVWSVQRATTCRAREKAELNHRAGTVTWSSRENTELGLCPGKQRVQHRAGTLLESSRYNTELGLCPGSSRENTKLGLSWSSSENTKLGLCPESSSEITELGLS